MSWSQVSQSFQQAMIFFALQQAGQVKIKQEMYTETV